MWNCRHMTCVRYRIKKSLNHDEILVLVACEVQLVSSCLASTTHMDADFIHNAGDGLSASFRILQLVQSLCQVLIKSQMN